MDMKINVITIEKKIIPSTVSVDRATTVRSKVLVTTRVLPGHNLPAQKSVRHSTHTKSKESPEYVAEKSWVILTCERTLYIALSGKGTHQRRCLGGNRPYTRPLHQPMLESTFEKAETASRCNLVKLKMQVFREEPSIGYHYYSKIYLETMQPVRRQKMQVLLEAKPYPHQ